jgi:alanine racemase
VTDLRELNSWIEISAGAYSRNLRFFRRRVGAEVELSAVVKANAYGHGMEPIARLAAEHGADSFSVHSLDEAQRLRRAGLGQEVLIMGHVPLARLEEAVAGGFRLVLYNRESAERLAAITADGDRRVRVHLKVETGTYRQGIDEDEVGWFADFLRRHPRLVPEGIYTHFANIEDTTDHGYARRQLERFEAAVARLRGAGLAVPLRHAACSAATLLFPRTHFEMVRLGVSQYGLWPSKETYLSYRLEHGDADASADDADGLEPVLTWKTRISQLKDVPAGALVGYGCTYQTTRRTRLAILPIGYSDGYSRRLSNQSYVLVGGRRAPVRGRVCMNLTMVDVTDVPGVGLEDEVVLIGRQGEGRVTAGQLADWIGTIHYEVVARISPELPRWVVE